MGQVKKVVDGKLRFASSRDIGEAFVSGDVPAGGARGAEQAWRGARRAAEPPACPVQRQPLQKVSAAVGNRGGNRPNEQSRPGRVERAVARSRYAGQRRPAETGPFQHRIGTPGASAA